MGNMPNVLAVVKWRTEQVKLKKILDTEIWGMVVGFHNLIVEIAVVPAVKRESLAK